MEQEYLDSHLSDIPKWANGKWERLGKSEIKTAIDLVRKPQQVAAKPAVKAEPCRKYQDYVSAYLQDRGICRSRDGTRVQRPRSRGLRATARSHV